MQTETATKAAGTGAPELVTREIQTDRPDWIDIARSSDHKQIGKSFIAAAFSFFAIAATAGLMTWIQNFFPNNTFMDGDTFNRLSTLHDTTMMFLFALPLMVGFILFAVPLMIGARGSAFPRLSSLAFWLYLMGGVVLYASLFADVPDAGLTATAPMSGNLYSATSGIDFWAASVGLVSLALTLAAIDVVTTVHGRRAPGVEIWNLPAFARIALVICWTLLLIAPVMIASSIMLLVERNFGGVVFFDSLRGGSPLLWQHMFWFFTHPASLLVGLGAAGIAAEVLPAFSRGRVSRRAIATSAAAVAFFGVFSWGLRLTTAPVDGAWLIAWMVAGLLSVVASIVLIAELVAPLVRRGLDRQAAALHAAGFVFFFALAAVGTAMLSVPQLGQQLLDSRFEAAYIGVLVIGSGVFGGLSGLHYWFPKMTGRLIPEGPARLGFALTFIGLLGMALELATTGLQGMPNYPYRYGQDLQVESIEGLIAMLLAGAGILLTLLNATRAARTGALAGPDPWHGSSLEWFVPSPPPPNNFDVVPPVSSDEPTFDLRRGIAGRKGELAGTVAQPTTAGRPSLKGGSISDD